MRESRTEADGMEDVSKMATQIACSLVCMKMSELHDLAMRLSPEFRIELRDAVDAIVRRETESNRMATSEFGVMLVVEKSGGEWVRIGRFGFDVGRLVRRGYLETRSDRGEVEFRMSELGRRALEFEIEKTKG